MIHDIPMPDISPAFTIEDIHKIREWDYERLKDATPTGCPQDSPFPGVRLFLTPGPEFDRMNPEKRVTKVTKASVTKTLNTLVTLVTVTLFLFSIFTMESANG